MTPIFKIMLPFVLLFPWISEASTGFVCQKIDMKITRDQVGETETIVIRDLPVHSELFSAKASGPWMGQVDPVKLSKMYCNAFIKTIEQF